MTKQELFDKVCVHLRKQGCHSKALVPRIRLSEETQEPECAYRSDAGSCAIGCLMLDSEYATWMEGNSLINLLNDERCPPSLVAKFPFDVWQFSLKLVF